MSIFRLLGGFSLVAMVTMLPLSAADSDAKSVFAAWAAAPATQPNIPDVSWAGYHHGDDPLPTPAVVVNVTACGAKPDDGQDDSPAFAKAIAQASATGGGAVEVPAGTWELDDVLRLSANGVVLRGAGIEKTKLLFRKPLKDLLQVPQLRGLSQWSWSGGLVWIGPANTWNPDGTLNTAKTLDCEAWEQWRLGADLGTVVGTAPAGATAIDVAADSSAKAGDWVILSYRNSGDHSLIKAMAGHESVGNSDLGGVGATDEWPWPVQITAITGRSLTLGQPLRMETRPEWEVHVRAIDGVLREAGIENLTIATSGFKPGLKHNTYPGWNGIYLNRCTDCFVRNVRIQDVDNGVIHAAAKNTTVTGFTITGGAHHHATALRVKSHDNLLEVFAIESQPMHGINTEGLSSGNVWRNGVMKHGTFDSHRGMSFDLLRTDITVAGDGRPGGGGSAGPFLGRRCVHWNIRITGGNGEFINQPEQHSMGALVGVQGPRKNGVSFAMPAGDKGTIIADEGHEPSIPDLYLAQLKQRLSTRKPPTGTTAPGAKKPAAAAAKPEARKPLSVPKAVHDRWNAVLAKRLTAQLATRTVLLVDLTRIGKAAEIQALSASNTVNIKTPQGVLKLPLASLAIIDRAALAVAVAGTDDPAGAACAAFFYGAAGDPCSAPWLEKAGPDAAIVRGDLGLPAQ